MTGSDSAALRRLRHADVTTCYDLGVGSYDALWSPVILPPAKELVSCLGLRSPCVVLDIGAGTGALLDAMRSAAPGARVLAVDASAAMLRVARERRGAAVAQADAVALPIDDESADFVVLAYVLFHVAMPGLALAEAARVLRSGGRVGTVTWARERATRAHDLWDETLAECSGLPPARPTRDDAGLDRPEAIGELLRAHGLQPMGIWTRPLRRQWDFETFWALAMGRGSTISRLARLAPGPRSDLLARARERLQILEPADYLWEGEVICATATKARPDTP